MPIPDPVVPVLPLVMAGVELAARRAAVARGLRWASVDELLVETNADREQADALADKILGHLATLESSPRPACVEPAAQPARLAELLTEALEFVMRHPGWVRRRARGERARYSAPFRQFVVELRLSNLDVPATEFAATLRLPLSTLEAWMIRTRLVIDTNGAPPADEPRAVAIDATQP